MSPGYTHLREVGLMQNLADHVNYPFHAIANFIGPLSSQTLVYIVQNIAHWPREKIAFYWAQLTKAK